MRSAPLAYPVRAQAGQRLGVARARVHQHARPVRAVFTSGSHPDAIPREVFDPPFAREDEEVSTENLPVADGGTKRVQRADKATQKRNRMVRLGVLIAGLIVITVLGYLHQHGTTKPAGVDALCPFGGIETFWSLVTSGALLQRIAVSSVVLLGAVVLVAVVFRRSFCGYICPLGAIQELFGKLGRKLFGKRFKLEVPAAIDRPARYLKYVVLAGIALWTWQAGALVIRAYDPWVAYMHLSSSELLAEFSIGAAILGITVVGSLLYDRFFCKYACPMGAFLGLITRFSLFKVRRNEDLCIDCGLCDKACGLNVKVSTATTVTSPECINCNECVNACPVQGALEVSAGKQPERRTVLSPMMVLGAVGVIIAATIGLATAAGAFAWTVPSLSETVEQSGGTFDVNEIKGRMSFMEISEATGIPAEEFQTRFGISAAEMETPIKDLTATYGFDVHTDVRVFVAEKLGVPYDPTATEAGAGGE